MPYEYFRNILVKSPTNMSIFSSESAGKHTISSKGFHFNSSTTCIVVVVNTFFEHVVQWISNMLENDLRDR